MIALNDARIGYAGYSRDFSAPGDRRRFCAYARQRGLSYQYPRLDGDYDLVVITQNADLTGWAARKRREGDRFRLVLDLVDGYFQQSRIDERLLKGIGRYVEGCDTRLSPDFRQTLKTICRAADAVWCSTPEQRATIERYNANVEISFDWIDDELGPPKRRFRDGERLKLVWEGQAGTLRTIRTVRDSLNALRDEVELIVVSDPTTPRYYGRIGRITAQELLEGIECPVTFHPWTKADFFRHIAQADVAIIPMDFSRSIFRAKPENKLVHLWKMGMPVLVAPTPPYCRAMAGAGLDMVCETPSEWTERLRLLAATPPDELEALGRHGRDYAMKAYGLAAFQRPFDSALSKIGFALGADRER
jgi:hypothetical protein